MKHHFGLIAFLLASTLSSFAQTFNLQQLLRDNKLLSNRKITMVSDSQKPGVSSGGIAWLKGADFSEGTIEVDLRGKDVPQQSFLGIAFHGVDTVAYDAVYFRPFNFQSKDSVKKIHMVQYVSAPEYHWQRLREEKNGIYEKGINPPPSPTEWFHARIVVKAAQIEVYVNNSMIPSLTVQPLTTRKSGLIGLWAFGLNGDYANLVIKK